MIGRHARRHAICGLLLLLGATPAVRGQDSLRVRPRPSLVSTGLPIAGLILGAVFVDDNVRTLAQDGRTDFTDGVASVANEFGDPLVVFPVLVASYLVGEAAGSKKLADISFRAGRAALLAGGATQIFKFGFGRERPSTGDHDEDRFHPLSGRDLNHSFPSGHAAVAFAVASSLASETSSTPLKVSLFAAATLTGYARINNDRHWLSDVLAGAALGIMSQRLLDRRKVAVIATPSRIGIGVRF